MNKLAKTLIRVEKFFVLNLVLICLGFSQGDVVKVSKPDLSSLDKISKLKSNWKYNLGDNFDWANPGFDDSKWKTTKNTAFLPDDSIGQKWKGMGWFRLKYKVDTSLLYIPLFVTTQQSCALQVYIDGHKLSSDGIVSIDKDFQECIVNWEAPKPASILFTDTNIHTIAVRYSNHPYVINSREGFPIGFTLGLNKQDIFIEARDKHLGTHRAFRWFFTAVPLTFALLHFFLFFFNRKHRANLHYAIFTVGCAGLTYSVIGITHNVSFLESQIRLLTFKLSLIVIFIAGLKFLYQVFYDAYPKQFYVAAFTALATIPMLWYISIPEIYILGFICIAEQLRIVIIANIKKKDGARIIGMGYLLFAIFCSIQMLRGFEPFTDLFKQHPYPYLDGVLGILICMSIHLARDITRTQKQLSMVTENQKETIAQLKTEMTERKKVEDLSQKQQQELIQADKMATLGILVSGVAHEINNPNNYMLLNSNNLTDIWKDVTPLLDKFAKEKGEFNICGVPYSEMRDDIPGLISSIAEGSDRIRKIVDSLKDFARKDPGSYNQNVNLYSVIEASTTIMANMIKKSTHNFEVECPPDLPPVKGNFQQLEQVIINLISNSCQALENQNQKLSVNAYSSNGDVKVEIADTGKGISQEDLIHIMDPFFTTKRDTGGTGLGLSITYTIVKDHRGELVYESEEGKGTKAILTLPITSDAE